MDSQPNARSDRKLLLIVAGCVVTGAVGLMIVAGWSTPEDTERLAETSRPPAAVEPARFERSLPSAAAELPVEDFRIEESTEDPAELVSPDQVVVDPAADPWQAGVQLYAAREYGAAVEYLREDAARRPDRAYTHYMLGLAQWKAGQLGEAVQSLERSAELNDRSIRTFVNLARVHLARGEPETALVSAEQALAIDALSTSALYQKARALYASDRVDEAVSVLEACVERDGTQGQAHNLLGLIRLRRGEWVAALESLEVAAALLPDTAYAQNNYGLALERAGRIDEAVVAFRRATEADPDHAAARASLARLSPEGVNEQETEPLAVAASVEADDGAVPAPPVEPQGDEVLADAGSPD